MLSLMIVDDELVVRRGLTTIVNWHALGFEIVGVYADGREAIEHLSRAHVDVVLTDVMMTFVSGLEVAQYVAEHAPDTRVVIVSGHQEFELARQAMAYGVVDYLLKPTQMDELTDCFERVRRQITARQGEIASLTNHRHIIRQYEALLVQLQDQLLLDVILGNVREADEIRKRFALVGLSAGALHGGLLSLRIRHDRDAYGKDGPLHLLATLMEAHEDLRAIPVHYAQDGAQVLLVRVGEARDMPGGWLEAVVDSIARGFEHRLPGCVQVLLTATFDGLDALGALKGQLFSVMRRDGNLDTVLHEYEKLIGTYLLRGEAAMAQLMLRELYDRLQDLAPDAARPVISLLFRNSAHNLQGMGVATKSLDEVGFLEERSLPALREHGEAWLAELAAAMKQDQPTNERNVIRKVQVFIERNCHRDITMYDVAEAVNYNPVYLSRMYKEKTGENYLEYLTKTRMARAKLLLADPRTRIGDISGRVGYKSQKYFTKLFRAATGMTPHAYRQWVQRTLH